MAIISLIRCSVEIVPGGFGECRINDMDLQAPPNGSLHEAGGESRDHKPASSRCRTNQAVSQRRSISHCTKDTLLLLWKMTNFRGHGRCKQVRTACIQHPSVRQKIHPRILTSIHPFIHLYIHPCIHTSKDTSTNPYIHTSIRPYIHTSMHPSKRTLYVLPT